MAFSAFAPIRMGCRMGTGPIGGKGQAFPADFFPNLRIFFFFLFPDYPLPTTAYCFSLPEANLSLNRAILSLNQANLSLKWAILSLNQAYLSLRKSILSLLQRLCSLLEANCSYFGSRHLASDIGLQRKTLPP
jgi:hypothetical protein